MGNPYAVLRFLAEQAREASMLEQQVSTRVNHNLLVPYFYYPWANKASKY